MMRTGRPRICIAHRAVAYGDAVGNDIAGTYRLLERCGYEVAIVCEFVHPRIAASLRVITTPDPAQATGQFDMLIYHHSIAWDAGEDLLNAFRGAIVVKYHNITPAAFFADYADIYRDYCERGREQTARLAQLSSITHWQADSIFNSLELRELGVAENVLGVVPPFNCVDRAFRRNSTAVYRPGGPFVVTFVGRRVPNKGHKHLLRTVAACRELYPEADFKCRVLGATDPQLESYDRELMHLEAALGMTGHVEWVGHLSDEEVEHAFRTSHVYLNLSEHEGFCLPLIEAQAYGLPAISSQMTAIPETAGAGQLLVPLADSQASYDLIAGLVREVCTSAPLRESLVRAGCRNVYQRFTRLSIECCFLNHMAPLLAELES